MNSQQKNQILAVIDVMRDISTPLLTAVVETSGIGAENPDRLPHTKDNHAKLFSQLLESTTGLARKFARIMQVDDSAMNDWARSRLASTLSHVVASYYRATAKPLALERADDLLPLMAKAAHFARDEQGVAQPFLKAPPVISQIQAIHAMTPVLSAIARFAFGRSETELLAELAEQLRARVEALIQQIFPNGLPPAIHAQLSDALLESVGKIYAEAHYAEMDRLLDMPPDDRVAYIKQYDNKPPMNQVWEQFDLRMDMLTVLVRNITLPAESVMDPEAA